jgi:hypothetical protein
MEITLNQIGLILDLIGIAILYENGLPSKYFTGGLGIEEGNYKKEPYKSLRKKNKRIDFYSKSGLVFIFIGFVVQFLAPEFSFTICVCCD